MVLLVAIAVLGHGAAASAAATTCPRHYPRGMPPELLRPTLARDARELCFEEFAVIYSGVSRTPLAAAEHLTRRRITRARGLERENAFHEEQRLPPEARSRLSDYARSGFDRGHMAPSGDMSSAEAQAESFSLANMAPQNPGSNRCLWEGIESAVRQVALREGDVWVLTGPLFQGETLTRLNERVLVPTGFYKAIFVPSRGSAGAYVAPNAPGMKWQAVSLARLRDLAGINAFPGVPAKVQDRAMRLPDPTPHDLGGSCAPGATVATATAHRTEGARAARSTAHGAGSGGTLSLVLAGVVAVVLCFLLYRALGRR